MRTESSPTTMTSKKSAAPIKTSAVFSMISIVIQLAGNTSVNELPLLAYSLKNYYRIGALKSLFGP